MNIFFDDRCDVPILSAREAAILAIIAKHQGKDDPVCTNYLERITGISAREIRKSIERLHRIFHQPICSFTGAKNGYYFAANYDELMADHLRWRSFGIKNIIRAFSMLPKKHAEEYLNQIAADLKSEISGNA